VLLGFADPWGFFCAQLTFSRAANIQVFFPAHERRKSKNYKTHVAILRSVQFLTSEQRGSELLRRNSEKLESGTGYQNPVPLSFSF
jgi:hypothetical protein